jgi:hypothetical protein
MLAAALSVTIMSGLFTKQGYSIQNHSLYSRGKRKVNNFYFHPKAGY